MEHPLGHLGSIVPVSPIPASCAPPAHLLLAWDERQKRPWCSASTAQKESKHVINTASNTNTKQGPMPVTKKINSIPDRASIEELPLLPSEPLVIHINLKTFLYLIMLVVFRDW